MLAVDDMIRRIVETLEDTGELDNTYLVFTSDNGFHLGQHRLGKGKQTPYDEDIRVPLTVLGPKVASNAPVDPDNPEPSPPIAAGGTSSEHRPAFDLPQRRGPGMKRQAIGAAVNPAVLVVRNRRTP
jgi:hypothetical protein